LRLRTFDSDAGLRISEASRTPTSGDPGQRFRASRTLFQPIYFGTHRKQGIDNFNKLWTDACAGIAWDDDSQTKELILRKEYDKEDLRIKW